MLHKHGPVSHLGIGRAFHRVLRVAAAVLFVLQGQEVPRRLRLVVCPLAVVLVAFGLALVVLLPLVLVRLLLLHAGLRTEASSSEGTACQPISLVVRPSGDCARLAWIFLLLHLRVERHVVFLPAAGLQLRRPGPVEIPQPANKHTPMVQ